MMMSNKGIMTPNVITNCCDVLDPVAGVTGLNGVVEDEGASLEEGVMDMEEVSTGTDDILVVDIRVVVIGDDAIPLDDRLGVCCAVLIEVTVSV